MYAIQTLSSTLTINMVLLGVRGEAILTAHLTPDQVFLRAHHVDTEVEVHLYD